MGRKLGRMQFSAHQHLTLLVEDADGYRNLCRLLTAAHSHTRDNTARVAEPAWTTLEEVERHAEGLVCLSGCARDGALAGAFERGDTALGERLGRRLLAAFGRDRFRVELQRPYWRRDRARNRWLALLAERLGVATVATGNVHAHARSPLPPPGRAGRDRAERDARVEPSRAAAATRPRRSPRPRRWRRASPSTPTRSPRPSASPSASLRPHRRARLPLPRLRGRGAPTASSPRSAPTLLGRALRRRPAPGRSRAPARARSWRRSAGSASPASSSSTATCSSSPARSRSRCAGPTSARSVLPPGRGRGSSVSSIVCYLTGLSHVDPVKAEPLLRPLPQRRNRLDAGHRPRLPPRHPRGADPARPRALRRTSTRRWSPPSRPTGRGRGARPRQGARAAAGGDRQGGEDGRLPRVGRARWSATWSRRSAASAARGATLARRCSSSAPEIDRPAPPRLPALRAGW